MPITYDEFLAKCGEYYGNAGICAAESSCLTPADLAKGLGHCLERIAPALEEALIASGELL